MRVRLRRWCRAASILALLHFSSLSCSSSSDQQQLDEFPDQQEFAELEQGEFNNLEGNAIADFNMGENNFSNFDANNDAFGGNNFANDGFGSEGNTFDGFQGNQFGENNFGFGGGEGDLQEIIEEMNQSGFDQFSDAPMGGDGMANAMTPMPEQSMATAGAPAAPGLPELGSKMSYIVQRGDTLAKIATKIYGDPSRWTELANFTGLANPRLIYPGDVVYYQLTEQSMAFAAAYESVTRSEVQVMEGDTLSTIASRVLGSSANWKLIWRQNDNIDNPDRLTAGTTIYYVEPSMLSAAVETFKEKFAQLQDSNLIAKQELDNNDAGDTLSEQVDQIDTFAGLDVDGEKFIQSEFGSTFAQLDQVSIFKSMI